MGENDTTARIVRGRVREYTTARGFTGITRPQTPADDDTDEGYDYCPYPTYPETPSATASLPEQSALPKASGSMTGTKIAHPTNGVLVLVVVIRRRRRRRQRLPRRGG